MERRMLLGIKARAERLARDRRSAAAAAMTAGETALRERLARVARRPRCRLAHYGRKTGRRHEVTIWFLVDGDVVYLATGDRRRQWVRNVLARPSVELRVDGATFHGEVEPVARPDEMTRVIELLKQKYWLSRPYLWFRGAPDAAFRVRVTD
jgi:deazaflavin-dependent oxidoreductase (nitroreductase family)